MRVRSVAVGAIGAVALIAAACGEDDEQADAVSEAAVTPAALATASAGGLSGGGGFAGEGTVIGAGAFNWRVVRVDVGTKPDIVLRPDGAPLVAYMLERQVLGFEGARRTVSLALTADGPMVAFIDEQVLALARQLDGEWGVEIVLEAGADPFQIVGLAVDSAGAPHLTFSTVTAHQPLDGEVWYVAPVRKGAG